MKKILNFISIVADFWYELLTGLLKNIFLLILIASSYWLFFVIGKVNGFYQQQEQLIDFTGNKSMSEIVQMVEERQLTGRLIIGGRTRFVDQFGNHWWVEDFDNNVSAQSIGKLEEGNVVISGRVKVDIQSESINSSQMTVNAFLDTAGRIGLALFYFGIVFLLFNHLKSSGASFFGKSFRKYATNIPKVTFNDVAGHSGPKKEVQEVVEYLKNAEYFSRTGAKPPRGVLLYGPPGNGKTLIAKAVAGEAKASYFEQNASTFVEMYVGVGAQRVRELFKEARKAKPSVIFIDELDSVGQKRSGGGNDERLQTINALLAEMDGFESNDGIVVIAATNRLEQLDEALIRPGRFDRKVMIPLPHYQDRTEILDVCFKRLPNVDVDSMFWGKCTQGFSGADLANLVNEAAVEATREHSYVVSNRHVEKARERILMGPKDNSAILTDEQKRSIAFHECGHAILNYVINKKIPEKISIVPRGGLLGATMVNNDFDVFYTPKNIESQIKVFIAGRASEDVFVGQISSASNSDLEKASTLAKVLIVNLGQSSFGPYIPTSETLLAEVESLARDKIKVLYEEVVEVLKDKKNVVNCLVVELLEKEELSQEQIQRLIESECKDDK